LAIESDDGSFESNLYEFIVSPIRATRPVHRNQQFMTDI